jgi:large subunit ribosomal protein L20
MARVKKALNAKKRHKKILKLAKGYYGSKSKQFRPANEAVMRALRSAYSGRKQKKRDYRSLWITRINAAARMNNISYSRLMHGLKLADVQIDRKILAQLAVSDMPAFTQLVDVAKAKLN